MAERRDLIVRSQTEVTLLEQEERSVEIPPLELIRRRLGEKVLPMFAKWRQEKILDRAEEAALRETVEKALQVRHAGLEIGAGAEIARLEGQATFFAFQVQDALVGLFGNFGMDVQRRHATALEKWGEMMTENIDRIKNNQNIGETYKKKILDLVDESGDEFVDILHDIARDLRLRIKKARDSNRED